MLAPFQTKAGTFAGTKINDLHAVTFSSSAYNLLKYIGLIMKLMTL